MMVLAIRAQFKDAQDKDEDSGYEGDRSDSNAESDSNGSDGEEEKMEASEEKHG